MQENGLQVLLMGERPSQAFNLASCHGGKSKTLQAGGPRFPCSLLARVREARPGNVIVLCFTR